MSKASYSEPASKPMRLGDSFREQREQRGLTLREVADAAKMDLTHLHKIELGDRLPTEEQATRLAKFFKLDDSEIQARWIAEKFQHTFAEHPAARDAIGILAEEAGIYMTGGKNGKGAR